MDTEKLKEFLVKKSLRFLWSDSDDFNPMDQSGGNFDDAYYAGVEDGEASMAQTLLAKFFT